ncbi:hypothetical protein CL622_04155 [archaeon]|nr:hypothetical protein [archaeon]
MNVLVVGSGGREHMLCKTLSKSPQLNKLFCYGTHYNPGIERLGVQMRIGKLSNSHDIISFSRINFINFAIIGPEAPLQYNLALDFHIHNIACIGPIGYYARIETDKAFARYILSCIHPEVNPIYKGFDYTMEISAVEEFIESLQSNIVIKANGLKGGKGVKVQGDHFTTILEGIQYIKQLIKNKDNFVIEEKLIGEEFSLMSFSDGTNISHMPIVQDYKRAYDGDQGPNTGSMGSISYANHRLPFLTDIDIAYCQTINGNIVNHLRKFYASNSSVNKYSYKGILYGSYMKTTSGEIKVIEFNARFGDPEVMNVLSILKTDFIQICKSIINGTLDQLQIEYEPKATVCKYLVPKGYPQDPEKKKNVFISQIDDISDTLIFSSVYENERCLRDYCVTTLGSRAIALIGKGDTTSQALETISETINHIHGPLYMRTDIGMSDKIKEQSEYEKSGVNIDEGNRFVQDLKTYAESTFNSHVVSDIGDFGGIFNLSEILKQNGYTELCLISSTDGVGTKSLFIERYLGAIGYSILGCDIVNHCINDILVQGGTPLYFLDYYATDKLNKTNALHFIKGISFACKKYNCVLLGGETAEMPDIYMKNRCDMAGTITGIVNKNEILHGRKTITEGDIVVALESSGPHTNGYSLIRKIMNEIGTPEQNKLRYPQIIGKLTKPHRCYLGDYKKIKEICQVKGLCHITGGGLTENVKRILPDQLFIDYTYDIHNYPIEFEFLQENGNISDEEMIKVFNCGIGMLVFLDSNSPYQDICTMLNQEHGNPHYAFPVGTVSPLL